MAHALSHCPSGKPRRSLVFLVSAGRERWRQAWDAGSARGQVPDADFTTRSGTEEIPLLRRAGRPTSGVQPSGEPLETVGSTSRECSRPGLTWSLCF